jgi:hypothetical protein
MRTRRAAAVLFVATLVPKVGSAQVYQFATPPPEVTASTAAWQIAGAPILVDGIVYYATALVRPFDGNVMRQVGVFDGVPVYADATLEPFSVVYVPVARGMRTYERQRSGDLAGTTGSQAPSMPIEPITGIRSDERAVATNGHVQVAMRAPMAAIGDVPARAANIAPIHPLRTRVESVPRPRDNDGVWIEYEGAKWYSDGAAVAYRPERFVRVGTYRGFPVYRERDGASHDIFVAVVHDGPLAPYAKR